MGKRKGGWSQERYFKLLAEGRGKGDLDQYKPWITTYDFPSKGKTIRIQGRITHRIHHLMSNNEKWCLLRQIPLFFTPYAVGVLDSNGRFSRKAAESVLGFRPRSLESSIRDMVLWLKKPRQ